MNILSHVAIIMDGNGRWGLKKNKTRKPNKTPSRFTKKNKKNKNKNK